MWMHTHTCMHMHTPTRTHTHSYTHTPHMGESTSVFIWRVVKLKCAYGDLRILTISRVKRIIKYFFVSILFCNLVRSIHPTTCRSMFSEANMRTRCRKWWKLLWIGRIPALYIWEVQSSLNFFFLNATIVRGLWAFRHHWQKCEKQMEVDSGGGFSRSTVSTLVLKAQWAEGCK